METYGKGKAYTRIDIVHTIVTTTEFRQKFQQLFHEFSRHIVPSWFLTNTKLELQKCHASRSRTMFITSDFAENVLIIRKHELAEQFFHRVEILLFGAVVSYITTSDESDQVLHHASYIVSSDYR